MAVKILVTIIVLLIGVMRVLYCLLSDRRTLAWSERMQQAGIFGRDQNGDPAIIMPVEAARALRLLAESAKKTGRWRSRRRPRNIWNACQRIWSVYRNTPGFVEGILTA